MRHDSFLRVPGEPDSVRDGVRLFFAGEGYREDHPDASESLVFRRGTRRGRLLSQRAELWPTVLHVRLASVGSGETGVALAYDVRTGGHLVGALDLAVFEAESAYLEDYLRTGLRRSVSEAVGHVRRPAAIAAAVNMIAAASIVGFVGILAGFPPLAVGVVALGVALLDGVVILSFADVVFEGTRRFERQLRQDFDPARPR